MKWKRGPGHRRPWPCFQGRGDDSLAGPGTVQLASLRSSSIATLSHPYKFTMFQKKSIQVPYMSFKVYFFIFAKCLVFRWCLQKRSLSNSKSCQNGGQFFSFLPERCVSAERKWSNKTRCSCAGIERWMEDFMKQTKIVKTKKKSFCLKTTLFLWTQAYVPSIQNK